MRNWPAELIAHLATRTPTIAYLVRVTRVDEAVFGFTSHYRDIPYGGLTYLAGTWSSESTAATRAGMNVDDMEMVGVLDTETISDADVVAGVWAFARVEVFVCNWRDLTMGVGKLRHGYVGEIVRSGAQFTAELRGLMQALQQSFGRIIQIPCDADVGDARCGVNLDTFTDGKVATTVTTVTSQRAFSASAITQASGWFDYGRVVFAEGTANAGVVREVKTQVGAALTLQLPFPWPITAGEAFTVYAGCDKTFATCKTKFVNWVRHRGHPFVPTGDRLLAAA